MRLYFLIWGTIFFVFSIIYPIHGDNKCYQAKICVHDGKEKCGKDPSGKIRRFIDSCDIKEYNCLKEADYAKVSHKECNDLPPIDEHVSKEKLKSVAAEDEKHEVETEDEDKKQTDPVKLEGPHESQHDSHEKDSNDIAIDRVRTTTITKKTTTIQPIHPRKAAVINEYWCWRARYCRVERPEVCGRDRRLGQRKRFYSECHLYSHNCDFETVVFYYSSPCLGLSNHPPIQDDPVVREKFAQYHCFKFKSCTPGGDRVCGYDDTKMVLAEFEDMCTLHKVNCQKRGFFTHVDASICEGQKKFQAISNGTDIYKNLTSV